VTEEREIVTWFPNIGLTPLDRAKPEDFATYVR
jgi:hypothetical protein